jgi:hypothetical protein
MKILNIILLFFSICILSIGQNIEFKYTNSTIGNISTLTVSAYNSTSGTENLTSFNYGFYFKSAETIIFGITPGATVPNFNATQLSNAVDGSLAGWSFDGTGAIITANLTTEGNTYDRLFIGSITDGNFNGSNIGSTPVDILTLKFDNTTGTINWGDFVFMGGIPQNTTWSYSDNSYSGVEYSIIAYSPTRTQELAITLPLILSDFNAEKLNEFSSLLTWKTSTEVNSDFFEIERSTDSKFWETIATVKAKGDSKSRVSYEYIDNNITLSRSKENIYYYKLRMVDRDGQFTYSEIRDVNFSRLKSPDLVIHPNPTNDNISLDLTVFDKNDGPIEINVYDMNGKQVLNRIITDPGAESIDFSKLPANTYNLMVKQGELICNEKVVKVE